MKRNLQIAVFLIGTCCCEMVFGRDIFVDNLLGNDSFDGALDHPIDVSSGPVRTLRRAMNLVEFGDRVILTRAGAVYYDSLSLTGRRRSGNESHPFTVIGNGAILSGQRAVTPQGWRQSGPDLWKLTLTRKGYNRLLRNGTSLPELQHESGGNPLESLAAGQWTAWQGSLYFRSDGEAPATQSFTYAAEQTGLTLYQVEHVRIVGITFRDFRFDGVHAQNTCRNVTLEGVDCINNGRAGFAISGSSQVDIVGGKAAENGRHNVLISNRGSAAIRDLTMDGDPTVVP